MRTHGSTCAEPLSGRSRPPLVVVRVSCGFRSCASVVADAPALTTAAFIDERRSATGKPYKDVAAEWEGLSEDQKKARTKDRERLVEEYEWNALVF